MSLFTFDRSPDTAPRPEGVDEHGWPLTSEHTERELSLMWTAMVERFKDQQRELFQAEAPTRPRRIRDAIIGGNEVQDPPTNPTL